MKYQKIKNVEKPLSKIIFGCAIPVMIQGEDADELLDEVYAQGITTFDTAENYGLSEASLGHWLKNRGNREKVVIISKGCHPYDGRDRVTPEDLKHDIEQSFERLGTDYIDIYLMHRDNPMVDLGPMVEILNEYHKAGRDRGFWWFQLDPSENRRSECICLEIWTRSFYCVQSELRTLQSD